MWIPFLVALAICAITARAVGNLDDALDGLLVLLNGCLVFATALGVNDGGAALTEGSGDGGDARPQGGRRSVGWRWLPPR